MRRANRPARANRNDENKPEDPKKNRRYPAILDSEYSDPEFDDDDDFVIPGCFSDKLSPRVPADILASVAGVDARRM